MGNYVYYGMCVEIHLLLGFIPSCDAGGSGVYNILALKHLGKEGVLHGFNKDEFLRMPMHCFTARWRQRDSPNIWSESPELTAASLRTD